MSEEVKWAIPKTDTLVRNPRTKAILPIDGGYVDWIGPEGRYWRRREKEGSIIIMNDKPNKEPNLFSDHNKGGKK